MFDIIKQEVEKAHQIGLVAGFRLGLIVGALGGVFFYLLIVMVLRSLL
jgi:hypothetical protein